MNATVLNPGQFPSPFTSKTAHVDEAAIKPLPQSRKVYIQGSRADIRVPMREISQSETPASMGAEQNSPFMFTTLPGLIQIRE